MRGELAGSFLTMKVVLRMLIMGAVIRPQEKNWRNTATTAWQTEAVWGLQRAIIWSTVSTCYFTEVIPGPVLSYNCSLV